MLQPNLNVILDNNKIIAKQSISTPGIYKIFDVTNNTNYSIKLKEFDRGISNRLYLWIASVNNITLKLSLIEDIEKLEFHNKFLPKIKIGILFKSPKYNDFFQLNDISLIKLSSNNILSPTKLSTDKSIDNKSIDNKSIVNKKYKFDKIIVKNKFSDLNNSNISVVIPCHYKHCEYLNKLLKYYDDQTLLPLEVIIVISEFKSLPNKYLENSIFKYVHNYDLQIIKVNYKSAAGNNRYIGSLNVNGDIIVFQDADDLPHKQRLEVINYIFNKHPDTVHICHKFDYEEITTLYNIKDIDYDKLISDSIFMISSIRILSRVTNGNVAIRKNICKSIEWFKNRYRGQDIVFNSYIYNKYRRSIFIKVPLYYYRKRLSVKKFI